MQVFKTLEEISGIGDTVIALGNFDGVHIGHQELISRAVSSAKVAGLSSAVFTFTNHPQNVMSDRTVIQNILSFEDKARIIESLGVEYLFTIDFTKEIEKTSPRDFVTEILMKRFRMREACCGFNYAFGNRGEGKVDLLAQIGVQQGFGLHILEPVKVDGTIVSSSLIREMISKGNMANCRKYLGRNYAVGGIVVTGNKIGRKIGFPTSNIILDESMVTPAYGVYATYATYNWTAYKSVTNVGIKPTIGDEKKTIETHIFDFSKDIYGKHIKVEFLNKLRDERKFENIEKLSDQIMQDCTQAKNFLYNYLPL